MLIALKVSNFAIIDHLEISFQDGLNILSGETGAGKSVILKSLALLMGEKAITDVVRGGDTTATIEGYFDLGDRDDVISKLASMGIEAEDETLVVRRIVSAHGKSKVYLNSLLSPLSSLRDIVAPLITVTGPTAPLIEMTGQHDNRHLQSKAYQMDILDRFGGTWKLRQSFEEKFRELGRLRAQVVELEEAARSREQRLDFLKFQIDEIEALNLKPGEDTELHNKVQRIRSSQKLIDFANSGMETLYESDQSVIVQVQQVLQKAVELSAVDSELGAIVGNLQQINSLIEDVVYDLREYGRRLEADPEELDQAEERLNSLRKLQKKFGSAVEDILGAFDQMTEEARQLTQSDEILKGLDHEIRKLETELGLMAKELHLRRTQGAKKLTEGVNSELLDLNMKGVRFQVQVAWLNECLSHGQSDIEFMIQPSKKEDLKPLARIASGGELSRILLSLKRILGSSEQPRTYLFDEVDTGVSGETAEKVGRKLKEIAKGQQVICVTHLPQVASFADSHFLIEKADLKSGLRMRVTELDAKDRVREIARLISGEKITQSSLDHARQLLEETKSL